MPLGGTKRKWFLVCLLGTIVLSSFFVLTGPVVAVMDGPSPSGAFTTEETATTEAATQNPTGITMKTIELTVLQPIVILLSYIVNFLLHLITIFAHLLIYIAGYNNFVHADAVTKGWVIVRDIANMFFVVVFLVIAIGTIMGAKQYHYKQTLPKLLLMAVLINFSRTICGVLIDFAQVIMLTFVNAFSQTAGGNFINGLGLGEIFKTDSKLTEELSGGQFFQLIFSEFLAILVSLVAFVVMVIMTIVLIFRIVMIWMLLVISPLAFFAWAMPSERFRKYFGIWFDDFVNNVISGPILAFFLWLALTVMASQGSCTAENPSGLTSVVTTGLAEGTEGVGELTVGASVMGRASCLLKYLISIGMLVGGLIMTKKLGVMGSDMAGKAPGWMQKQATGAAKWVGRKGWQGVDERYRLKERGFGAISRIPGFKSFGVTGATKSRIERAARMGKLEPAVSAATPQELDRLLKMRPITLKDRDMKALAHQKALHDWKYQKGKKDEFTKKYEAQGLSPDDAEKRASVDVKRHMGGLLKDYDKLAAARGDRKMQDDAYSIKQSRPDLVSLDAPHSQRVKDIQGITKLMTPLDARNKISDLAIEDAAVWEALSPTQRTFIEEKGSAAQKSAVDKMRVQGKEYQTKHPEVIKDVAERTKFVQNLGAGVVNIDAKSLGNKEVVGVMTDAQIGELVKADKLQVGAIDASRLTANNGAMAGRIVKEGSPTVVREFTKNMGPDFANAIDSYRRTAPGLSADEDKNLRVVQFIASADLTKSFDYDKTARTFATAGGADSFYGALHDRKQNIDVVAKLDIKEISSNNYDNGISQDLAMDLDKTTLGKLAKSPEVEPEVIEAVINSIKATIKNLPSQAPELSEKLKYCSATPGLREFV